MVLCRKERIRKHGGRELVSEGKAVSYTKECSGFFFQRPCRTMSIVRSPGMTMPFSLDLHCNEQRLLETYDHLHFGRVSQCKASGDHRSSSRISDSATAVSFARASTSTSFSTLDDAPSLDLETTAGIVCSVGTAEAVTVASNLGLAGGCGHAQSRD